MLPRYAISDADWDRIKHLLPGRPGPARRGRRQDDQALGRSREGFGTKIDGSFDGLGHPVEFKLTAARESDIAQAEGLLAGHAPEVVIADRGYDKKALVEEIESRGARAVIPTQKNRSPSASSTRTCTASGTCARGSGPRPRSTGGWPPGTRRRRPTSSPSWRWPRSLSC